MNHSQWFNSLKIIQFLIVGSLYLYADHVFGYENWSHEIKNQTIDE